MQTNSTTQPGILPGPYETYFGGKGASGAVQAIINCMRPHDIYMELFLGNGYVFRCKKLAELSLLNDLNKQVVNDWKDIPFECLTQTIQYMNSDAVELLASLPFSPTKRYCIYLDPPYPISSRSTPRETYECEMTDDDHRELLNVLRYLPDNVDVLISTYANPIYAELLADWHLITFPSRTQAYTATEFLYMNYVPDGVQHDYSHIGKDRTDRQRIRRKIAREVARLKALPAAERNAIITAVADSTNYAGVKSVTAMVNSIECSHI